MRTCKSRTGAGGGSVANETDTGAVQINIAITVVTSTLAVSAPDVAYDASAYDESISVTVGPDNQAGSLAYTYYSDADGYTSALSGAPTNAGNYKVVVDFTPANPSAYTSAQGSDFFMIGKANANVVVTPYTSATTTYDGQAHTATYTIAGVNGETGATVGTVNVSDTTHTNAGTYASDSWSFTGTANYNDISSTTITDSIAKANATVVVTPYSVTYNGQAHTATYTITGVNGETGATVGTVDVSNTTHTNAGTYASDSWSFTGTANYNDISSTTITDSIAAAQLDTAASNLSSLNIAQNGAFVIHLSSVSGFFGTDNVNSVLSGATFQLKIFKASTNTWITYSMTASAVVNSDGSVDLKWTMSQELYNDLHNAWDGTKFSNVELNVSSQTNNSNYCVSENLFAKVFQSGNVKWS